MDLHRLESAITREERNKLNENFGIIENSLGGLRSQVNNIVASAGEDNSENVAARTNTVSGESYVSVGDRLDSEYETVQDQLTYKADQSFVDAQFASIVSGSPKGTFTDYASLVAQYPQGAEGTMLVLADGHWYYWNSATNKWEDGGLYQAQGIADKSVTPAKTTFLKQTKNLATAYLTKTVAGTASALFTMPDNDTSLNNGRTMIVPIENGKTYTVTVYDKNESNILAIASDVKIPSTSDYDSNNRYYFKTTLFLSTIADNKTYTFTNSDNDDYLFICVSTTGLEPRLQVEESDVKTHYVEPIALSQDIIPLINEPQLPNTRNLVTGKKMLSAFTSASGRAFVSTGTDDVFIIPIEQGKTYTVNVNESEESNIFVVATHSKLPSYYDTNGRSYLNTHILTVGGSNMQRTVTFTNTDDRYLFVKAYSGQNKDVKLQVEEGAAATDYVHPFDFGIATSDLVKTVDLADELNKSIYQHDYKALYPFDTATTALVNGAVTVETNTDPVFTRHNNISKKLTFNTTTASRHQLDFTLSEPLNLYDKNFGIWFYIPRNTLMDNDQQRGKWKDLAFMFYTASGKIFQMYPQQPKRAWGGWNLMVGNPFNSNFSDGSLTFEDLKQVIKIRVHVERETSGNEPFEIYLDSLVTWKRLNKIVARFEFDDAYRAIYENAFPEMKKRGIRGCMHVITDRLTNNINNMFATVPQLKQMHDVGWDVCSHTKTHPYISTLTSEQIEDELRGSQEILHEHGFKNGTDVYVAPYGDNTVEAVEIAKKYYKVWRNTGYQRADDVLTPHRYGLQCFGAGSLGLAGCKALVDRAVARGGGYLPFMWHGEIGETWDGVRWETSEFAELLDYCIANGVEFVTYSDQYK